MTTYRVDGMVVVDADESGLEVVRKGTVQDWPLEYAYPDLTDPATLGCLMALVREAWEPATVTKNPLHSPRALVKTRRRRRQQAWQSAAGCPRQRRPGEACRW